MNFKPYTQDELKKLNIVENETYKIEYLNKDYFNGEETIEITTAKAIINDGKIIFVVIDPYGMDKFVNNVKIVK